MRNDRNRADIFIALLVIAVILFIIGLVKRATEQTINTLSHLKREKEKELELLRIEASEMDTLGKKLDRKVKNRVALIKWSIVTLCIAINIAVIYAFKLDPVDTTLTIWSFLTIAYLLLCFLFSNKNISPLAVVRWMEKGIRKRMYRKHEYSPEKVQQVDVKMEEVKAEINEITDKIEKTKKESLW